MEEEDPIKKLLQQTGWSYADILKKLEAYKDHSIVPKTEPLAESTEDTKLEENSIALNTGGTSVKPNTKLQMEEDGKSTIKEETATSNKEQNADLKNNGKQKTDLTHDHKEETIKIQNKGEPELNNKEEDTKLINIKTETNNQQGNTDSESIHNHEEENTELQGTAEAETSNKEDTDLEYDGDLQTDNKEENTELENNVELTHSNEKENIELQNKTESEINSKEEDTELDREETQITTDDESKKEDVGQLLNASEQNLTNSKQKSTELIEDIEKLHEELTNLINDGKRVSKEQSERLTEEDVEELKSDTQTSNEHAKDCEEEAKSSAQSLNEEKKKIENLEMPINKQKCLVLKDVPENEESIHRSDTNSNDGPKVSICIDKEQIAVIEDDRKIEQFLHLQNDAKETTTQDNAKLESYTTDISSKVQSDRKITDPTDYTTSGDVSVVVHIRSSRKTPPKRMFPISVNFKRKRSNVRLRILRKYVNRLAKTGGRSEIQPKISAAREMHNKLKEQLDMLRNKRKYTYVPVERPKISSASTSLGRDATRLRSITSTLLDKLNGGNLEEVRGTSEAVDELNAQPSKHTDEDVLPTNETDFMIVNVMGGYKSPTPEPQHEKQINYTEKSSLLKRRSYEEDSKSEKLFKSEVELSGIKPTKTTDVTKIKGWKNKKFVLTKKDDWQNKSSNKLLHQLLAESESTPESSSLVTGKESNSLIKISNGAAFASDVLEQFLTDNSNLNISYELPKLDAEQTLSTSTYIDIKYPSLPPQNTNQTIVRNKDHYRPKTLAEKRKMLAKPGNPHIKDFLRNMTSKQRKDYAKRAESVRKKLIEEDVPFTRRCFMASMSITNTYSYVVYNGKKLKVPSTTGKEILTKIKDKRKLYKASPTIIKQPKISCAYPTRKPSLLGDLKSEIRRLPYNPDEWETVQMKLPILTLKLLPQIGKRVHPKVEHLINTGGTVLTKNRVQFALSALKIKNSTTPSFQTFTFPLNYANNQQSVKMRKRLPIDVDLIQPIEQSTSETDTEISATVADVVTKMLDYIDILETTKEAVVLESDMESYDTTAAQSAIEGSDEKTCRRKKRKIQSDVKSVQRTTLEMRRLNCKIVSISVDEENGDGTQCAKEFCKLGCVCKSIDCSVTSLLPNHCGLPKCMFNCTCTYNRTDVGQNISLPAGTDIFSEGIINRISNEAKRNLAKVEKEFTQTVIKTNNQIIMVGDSKERRRRATKMPKKYIDFVEEDPENKSDEDRPLVKYVAAKRIYRALTSSYEEDKIKPCSVKLLKTNFSDIMPYCMVHNFYKCFCKNKAIFNSEASDKCIVPYNYTPLLPKLLPVVPVDKPQSKLKKQKSYNKELNSVRTLGLITRNYHIRNKTTSHRSNLIKSSKKLQRDLEHYLRQNANTILKEVGEETAADSLKPALRPEIPKASHRRKQSLITLKDHSSNDDTSIAPKPDVTPNLILHHDAEREPKLQRRKVKQSAKIGGQELVNTTKNLDGIAMTSLFKNTKKLKGEFSAILGKRATELRLLPWTTLVARHETGKFQLWYAKTSKACSLVITENGACPSPHHHNINCIQDVPHTADMPSEVVRWLVTKKVPVEKSPDNILLVLSCNNSAWEICGVCEKNEPYNEESDKDPVTISLIDSWSTRKPTFNALVDKGSSTPKPTFNTIVDKGSTTPKPTVISVLDNESGVIDLDPDDEPEEDYKTKMLIHENLQANKKIMYCSSRRFQPKKLISDDADNESLNVRQVLWAPIPSVTLACKWRVIYMSMGFAYLSLTRSNYTMKYDDLMKGIRLAHIDKQTVLLQSKQLQENYPHRNFGIYCVHNYSDKVFVGPYFLNEYHDLETLSYVDNVLVNTRLFNRIKGKTVPGSSLWFHQATSSEDTIDDDITIVPRTQEMIDLTCESDEDLSDSFEKENGSVTDPPLLKSILLTPPDNSYDGSDEETEKTLDTLLKAGQLNVNKQLVNLDNLKPLHRPDRSPSRNRVSKNTSGADDSGNNSEGYDEEKLLTDETLESDKHLNPKLDVSRQKMGDELGQHPKNTKYLVTNVPNLGYILAFQHENSTILDVECPITGKIKRFSVPEMAITSLERVLSHKFMVIPPTFKIQVKLTEKPENSTDGPLDGFVLDRYHIAGSFGVKNIRNSTVGELENLGIDKTDITNILLHRDDKEEWEAIHELAKCLGMRVNEMSKTNNLFKIFPAAFKEIETLAADLELFIDKKIALETKKVNHTETCSKLICELPIDQRMKQQQKLDEIINFSNKQSSNCPTFNKGSHIEDSIRISDDDKIIELLDDDAPSKNKPESIPSTVPKFKLTRGPVVKSATSLLSGKRIEIGNPTNLRSLLTSQFQNNSDGLNKYRIVRTKRTAAGNVISNPKTIDLSKCTFKLKPSGADEKLLLNKVPIPMGRKLVRAASFNGVSQQRKVFLTPITGALKKSCSVNGSISILNNASDLRDGKDVVETVTSSSTGGLNTPIPITNNSQVNVVPSTNLPLLCVPVSVVPTPAVPGSNLMRTGTMATLTPISKPNNIVQKSLVLKNNTGKNTPNYIAIKDGNEMKYFQLVSDARLSTIQTVKRKGAKLLLQPAAKRIAPAPPSPLIATSRKTD